VIVVALTLLLVWLYAEVALLLYVSQHIGFLSALLLTIVSGGVGYLVVRRQLMRLAHRLARELNEGPLTVDALVDMIGLLAAGLLMITPGLITDVAGSLLLVPPVRRVVGKYVFGKWSRWKFATTTRFRRPLDDDRVIDGVVEDDKE